MFMQPPHPSRAFTRQALGSGARPARITWARARRGQYCEQLLWLTLFTSASSCIPKVEDDISTVNRPRLLAVKSTPAEAAPGGSVALEALVAAPDGVEVPTVAWYGCRERKALTELGPVNPLCLDPGVDTEASPFLGTGEGVGFRVFDDACQLFGPTLPPPVDGQPSGRPADPDPTGGYYQPYVASLEGEGTSLGSLRLTCGPPAGTPRDQLILYNEQYAPNGNPAMASLLIVGASQDTVVPSEGAPADTISVKPGQHLTLRAAWAPCPRTPVCGDGLCTLTETSDNCAMDCLSPQRCTGAESYVAINESKQVTARRESIIVSWYSTQGLFDNRRTGVSETDPDEPWTENGWLAPDAEGVVNLWLALRDDRGGVGWNSYRVDIRR